MLVVAVIAAGVLGAAAAWRLEDGGRISVWVAMPTVSGAAGVAAAATGRVALSSQVSWPSALGSGTGTGLALYAATVAVVRLARRHPFFERRVREVYARREGIPLPWALLLGAGVTAVGEELFWRGLGQGWAGEELGPLAGAVVTWGAYVAVNGASGSLPILAAALVPGAVWGALALWTQGALASLGCHVTWTALMVARPPVDLLAGGPSRPARPGRGR